MQEDDSWSVLRAGFPIENPDTVDLHAMIGRRSVGRRQRRSLCRARIKGRGENVILLSGSLRCSFFEHSLPEASGTRSVVRHEAALAALGASNLFERQGIDVLTVTFDFPVPDIPYMRVCKVSAFVRCTVYAREAAQ